MLIFARQSLVPDCLTTDARALLLEGDWCKQSAYEEAESLHSRRQSLDSAFDKSHAWIDKLAHELAEAALSDSRFLFAAATSGEQLHAGDVFALKLRYAFVKWLRVVAFLTRQTELRNMTLFVDAPSFPADAEYVLLLQSVARQLRCDLTVHDAAESSSTDATAASQDKRQPVNRRTWRSWAQRVCQVLRPRRTNRPSVMFLGSPRILDPICAEFAQRGVRPVWLREQFAPRSWLKWRRHGGEQFVINAQAPHNSVAGSFRFDTETQSSPEYLAENIDLFPCVTAFLQRQVISSGANAHHARRRIAEALQAFHPTCLVLDEDATPRKRVAVAAAAKLGIPTFVIQHGVPRLQFGFAPLAADCLLSWGELSKQRLMQFGIPNHRIAVTGRADWQPPVTRAQQRDAKAPWRLLLIGTTPPRDDRPEPVGFHLTTKAHRQLLQNVFVAANRFSPVELVIKRHPRCGNGNLYRELQGLYPNINCVIAQHGDVNQLVAASDVVLNVASGAGVEAAAAGAKVIELIPSGGEDLLPSANWGALGSATTKEEIHELIKKATSGEQEPHSTNDSVRGLGASAARPWRNTSSDCRPFSGSNHSSSAHQREVNLSGTADIFAATGRAAARLAVNEMLARLREPGVKRDPGITSPAAASTKQEVA